MTKTEVIIVILWITILWFVILPYWFDYRPDTRTSTPPPPVPTERYIVFDKNGQQVFTVERERK